tara:strand:+ start:8161 stop:8865 length:705 start_codon:yes stop_codon:yes gene_type:complete
VGDGTNQLVYLLVLGDQCRYDFVRGRCVVSFTRKLFMPTIIDLIFGPSIAASVVFVAAAAGFIAIVAQIVVPLNPVPITGQTFAVILIGLSFGATRAALVMLLYVLLGLSGLPVFSSAQGGVEVLLGPSGGYILGYIPAAWLVGTLAQRGWNKSFWSACAAGALGTVVMFTAGVLGLRRALIETHREATIALLLETGVTPFLVGATLKVILAAAIISLASRSVLRHQARTAVDS